jgi:hypothetical protein
MAYKESHGTEFRVDNKEVNGDVTGSLLGMVIL